MNGLVRDKLLMGAVAVRGNSCGVEDSKAEVWGRDSWMHRSWGIVLYLELRNQEVFFR